MKAAIAVDNWKLPVFRRRLKDAGYNYQDGGAFTGDTTILTVETDDMLRLKKVVEKCQSECRSNPDPSAHQNRRGTVMRRTWND